MRTGYFVYDRVLNSTQKSIYGLESQSFTFLSRGAEATMQLR